MGLVSLLKNEKIPAQYSEKACYPFASQIYSHHCEPKAGYFKVDDPILDPYEYLQQALVGLPISFGDRGLVRQKVGRALRVSRHGARRDEELEVGRLPVDDGHGDVRHQEGDEQEGGQKGLHYLPVCSLGESGGE